MSLSLSPKLLRPVVIEFAKRVALSLVTRAQCYRPKLLDKNVKHYLNACEICMTAAKYSILMSWLVIESVTFLLRY